MDSIESLNTVTKFLKKTDEEQKQILRSFTKMFLDERIKVMEIQKSIFYQFREHNKGKSLPLLTYVSLIKAIEKYKVDTNTLDTNVIGVSRGAEIGIYLRTNNIK